MFRSCLRMLAMVALLVFVTVPVRAQVTVTSPKEHLGHNIGDDYYLATYGEMMGYWKVLEGQSDRVALVDIGQTAEGRTQTMAIVTSPANHKRLDYYKGIAQRLAHAEGLTEHEARKLAAEGKAVVWIDGGQHATEVVGAQQLIETVYQLVSGTDAETLRFLNDVIVLCVPANPDGMDLVSGWYMRSPDPLKRSTAGVPRLYQKYAGHDNNRDSYMVNLAETENMHRVLYREWFPQILYNHHQTAPVGTVVFMPPFRDPFNYYYDPLIPLSVESVALAMHSRFVAEGKPGSTMRSAAPYSTWWNGGLRTTAYFHNMIGLLTEIIGNPTPIEIPLVPMKLTPTGDYPFPILPQKWVMRQSIEYEVSANRAVLDVASRQRDTLLFNMYTMGKNAIEKGSRDTWTITPKKITAMMATVTKEQLAAPEALPRGLGFNVGAVPSRYVDLLRTPEARDPRGYIMPSDQPDFLTAVKFINTFIKNGMTVHRATSPFTVGGEAYPAGSYVVKAAQAFRPYVLDIFEPQDYPDVLAYVGGPLRPPYDSAGWTPAFTMGVAFDRILDAFDGPFEVVTDVQKPPAGVVAVPKAERAIGYLLSCQPNDAFRAINRLLGANEDVYRLTRPATVDGTTWAVGTVYIASGEATAARVKKLADDVGLDFTGTASPVPAAATKLRRVRVGLWDRYGGSIPSGWTRLLFEQFEFPFEVVYAPTLDAGGLAAKYDVLVFVDGAIPRRERRGSDPFAGALPRADEVPTEYRSQLGSLSLERTMPQLRQFVEAGGRLLAIGGSTAVAAHFRLPVTDALVEMSAGGAQQPLGSDTFYIPGSVLSVAVNPASPLAWGMPSRADVYFDNSPAFRLMPDAGAKGLRSVAWFDSPSPLRSGWARGQGYLEGTTAVIDAAVGKGRVFLYGPEVAFRAQPHGTYKLLFNAIYYGGAS